MVPKQRKMPTLDAAGADSAVRLKVGYNGSVTLQLGLCHILLAVHTHTFFSVGLLKSYLWNTWHVVMSACVFVEHC